MEASEITFEYAINHGFNKRMIERYKRFYGDENALKIVKSAFQSYTKTIRLNKLKKDPKKTLDLLIKKKFELEDTNSKMGYHVTKEPFSIGATPEYLAGYYMLQGLVSQQIVEILNPKSDQFVLDLAASPGGKTTYISQLMENKGRVIAIERFRNRMYALKNNILRMGINNVVALLMDGKNIHKLDYEFDKILLDAPCSGSGILHTDKSRIRGRTNNELKTLSKIQTQLALSAIDALKTNGTLLYTTCSMEPEENELVMNEILKEKQMKIVSIEIPDGVSGLIQFQNNKLHTTLSKTRRIFPTQKKDGFFICQLVKLA